MVKAKSKRSHWASDSGYPVRDWQDEVASGDTRLGYAEWLKNKKGLKLRKNPGEGELSTEDYRHRYEARKKLGWTRAQANKARLENEVRTHDRFQASWAMRNMIRALGMMAWQNTVEDWQRLYEAKIVMAARSRMRRR